MQGSLSLYSSWTLKLMDGPKAAYLWNRQKDLDSGAKAWAKEHRSERPWFADHVPEVQLHGLFMKGC